MYNNRNGEEFCKEMGMYCEFCKNGECFSYTEDIQFCFYGYLMDDEEPLDEEF